MKRQRASQTMIPRFIDTLKELRAEYRQFTTAEERRFATETDHNHLYDLYGSGKVYRQKLEEAKQAHAKRTGKARKQFKDGISEAVANLETQIRREAGTPFTVQPVNDFLRMNIPVNHTELEILSEQFGGTYWSDKILAELAKQNGVTNVPIPPDAEIQLTILSDVLTEAENFCADPKRDGDEPTIFRMTDRMLNRWETELSNGLLSFTPEQLASRALETATKSGQAPVETALKVGNIYLNLKRGGETEALDLFLAGLAERDLDTSMLSFCGTETRDAILAYRRGERIYQPKQDSKKSESEDKPLSDADKAVASALSAKVAEVKAAERAETSAE